MKIDVDELLAAMDGYGDDTQVPTVGLFKSILGTLKHNQFHMTKSPVHSVPVVKVEKPLEQVKKTTTGKLKLFNFYVNVGIYKYQHCYVAHESLPKAAEIASSVLFGNPSQISKSEANKYWHKNAWGNKMDGIVPTEPCVWVSERNADAKPQRLI